MDRIRLSRIWDGPTAGASSPARSVVTTARPSTSRPSRPPSPKVRSPQMSW